jgi:hypothetical protein
MLAACSKEDTLVQQAPEAIGFDNAFVENSTRSVETPGYSTSKLFNDFAVYGFVEGASLFDGVRVAKGITNTELTSQWKYAGTQYWITGANYDFYAVAPFFAENNYWRIADNATKTDAGTTITFTNADGTQDLLYSGIVEKQGAASNNGAVAFTFKHILSKVKFSFVNGYNASAATICVRDIKITNAYATGDAALAASAASWSEQAGAINVAFGNATTAADYKTYVAPTDGTTGNLAEFDYAYNTTVESYYERFLIPATQELNISFKVDLLVSGQKIATYDHTAKANVTLEPGKSYDIAATINASNIDPNHAQEPIEFTATMTDWSTANDATATVDTIQQGTQN